MLEVICDAGEGPAGEWRIAPTVRIRYDTGVKAKHWANLLVERQGSGGLALTFVETKEGRLAG